MKYSYQYLEDEWTKGYWNFIENNLDKKLTWLYLSHNPNITWEIIQNNPDKPWVWEAISYNKNLTWEIIQNNLDNDWNWDIILDNNMKNGKETWINNLRLKTIKALQIQRHWRNCVSNPEYTLAQKLIKDRLNS